jgi:DNA-binding MarR family transcriptional regulator
VSETRARMDALGTARICIRLVRLLEQQTRCHPNDEPLTLTEVGVLGQIDRGQTLPSTIARMLALDPARVTRITDHLFALGYVQREADPQDRRRCPLRLTAAGAERLERGRKLFSNTMAAILEGLTEEELAALQVGTDGLARVLDQTPVKQ